MRVALKMLGGLLLCALGCGPEALPREAPSAEYRQAMQRAERASRQAEEASLEVEREIARATRLRDEVTALLARVEAAERRCEGNVAKIAQMEEARRRAARQRAEKERAERAVIEAQPTPTPEPEKPKDPEYSPSDAPM